MEIVEKDSRGRIGTPKYINKNCWLAQTLAYPPARRCLYCELRFRYCPFYQYLIVGFPLMLFSFALSLAVEGKIFKSTIVSVFSLVVIYGYFFTKSTEKLVEANFAQKQSKEALEKAKLALEGKVEERTKELKELTESLDAKVKEKTKELQKKIADLEKFHKLTVGRELKMVELKKEMEELKKELETHKSQTRTTSTGVRPM